MLYSQYCRIESRAGGCSASPRAMIRAARTLLAASGKSREQRNLRHKWLREMLAKHAEARALYRAVMRG